MKEWFNCTYSYNLFQTEIIRQVLAEKLDFDPYATFRALDRLGNGYLVRSDICNFLWRNNSDATE